MKTKTEHDLTYAELCLDFKNDKIQVMEQFIIEKHGKKRFNLLMEELNNEYKRIQN